MYNNTISSAMSTQSLYDNNVTNHIRRDDHHNQQQQRHNYLINAKRDENNYHYANIGGSGGGGGGGGNSRGNMNNNTSSSRRTSQRQNRRESQRQNRRRSSSSSGERNDRYNSPSIGYNGGGSSTLNRNVSTTSPSSIAISTNTDWTSKCINLDQIIRYFRTNDYSNFDVRTVSLMNTIRDIFMDTSPLDINVVKRFDSDEGLMRHYERLVNENGGSAVPSDIFVESFMIHILPTYAQKFHNKGNMSLSEESLKEAANYLGLAFQYEISLAISQNMRVPLAFSQGLADEYMTLLLRQAQIPENIQSAVKTRLYKRINNINDLVNNVIDNVFAGGNDYYYYILNEENRARVISLKENLAYLGALSETTNVFEFIAELATRKGKQPGLFREAYSITHSNASRHKQQQQQRLKTSIGSNVGGGNNNNMMMIINQREEELHMKYRRSLSELAFQNEALRRFIFQQLSYKSNKRNNLS
ncbi:gp41 [Hemileuca sp. nucleopolyhedrovirus]|uniref:Gp41 n=1 Tax=Hemileuca sp. nucleopolyhedrovirus TaxID=1367203 RepID=S5MQD7_9ABAC|nr:gp41 [Hemileuca sp. nucleopolyhedrovirus]AGR56824.1 gp41 [Hemileuca sp. nucleopolyhedrovirus]